MSRLATLSSTYSNYSEAIQSLASLYIKRGYPQDLVYKWIKDNITDRWVKRLNETRHKDTGDVLVLKSYFNTAWNYFSAHELGETILGYWRQWINHAAAGHFTPIYPMFSGDPGELVGVIPKFLSEIVVPEGTSEIPDISKIPGFTNRRLIVSRRRTRNLFDLTNLWKNIVIYHLDKDFQSTEANHTESVQQDEIEVDDSSSDSDHAPDLWQSGSLAGRSTLRDF
jgi:hypothetical protein